jgi:hypothetical protein
VVQDAEQALEDPDRRRSQGGVESADELSEAVASGGHGARWEEGHPQQVAGGGGSGGVGVHDPTVTGGWWDGHRERVLSSRPPGGARSGCGCLAQSMPISSAWRAISRRLERPSFNSTADTWWSAVLGEM